jgi:nucleoside-diphosphate kinase
VLWPLTLAMFRACQGRHLAVLNAADVSGRGTSGYPAVIMSQEHTFIMVKPDGVRRGLVGEVISRFERKGLHLEKIRKLDIDEDLARRHYAEHIDKPFFPELLEFITSGPVVAMEWSGESAVSVSRTMMGATDPKQAAPGTVRGDLGLTVTHNLVHSSDSVESAQRELGIFFG